MKIGIITDSIRDQATGIGFYARDIIAELIKENNTQEYLFIDYLETEFNKKYLLKIANPFRYFKTYSWHSYLPLKSRNLDVDYIVNFSSVPHFYPYKQKEIYFVYDISWYLYPEYHPKSRVLFYKTFFKRTLKNSYKIITDSISAKNDLINYFSINDKKISVIYPSVPIVEIKDKKLNFNMNKPYLLYIGTLEPRKNIVSIIKAFKELKDKRNIKHKLVLCGKKGWLYESIFTLIKKLKLDSDVIYLGYITEYEKKHLIQNADCFVFPSNYEGFGIPVIEAINYGCPVITSNISSLPEAAGDAGIKINPQDISALSRAIEQIIFDKKLKASLISAGKKHLESISNKKQIEYLINVINE